jgi:fusion protein PurCD
MRHLLILGSGAREHAIALQLAYSNTRFRTGSKEPYAIHAFGTNANPGIMDICGRSGGSFRVGAITDPIAVVAACTAVGASLVIIGPESPLETGTADALRAVGIGVVGPDKLLARIETSKSFARSFLFSRLVDACPEYHIVDDLGKAAACIASLKDSYVIKADGLAGGKGVLIAGEHLFSDEEALAHCATLLKRDGRPFVIEERLEGEEFSLMTVTDGTTCLHLPPLQDHKRAFAGDRGPNTGGMGSYTGAHGTLPFLTPYELEVAKRYNELVVRELGRSCGAPYRGILYGGFMATASGVKIIEYNARFGDPEALNLMHLLKSDGIELFERVADGTLDSYRLEIDDVPSVCIYVVPEGYPTSPGAGDPIAIGQIPGDVSVCMGSLERRGAQIVTGGSRALALVSDGPTIGEAREKVLGCIGQITGKVRHRADIGSDELVEKRITHMQGIRKPLRIAILGSTNGTDMDAIIAGIKLGEVPASIVLVASDRSDAPILARAAGHGIPIAAATEKGLARDGQLSSLCEQHDVELIILIGYMRILSETFCSRWEHRILNVHPSLLPEFAGTMDQDTHTLAIKRMRETGNRITGCTVHLVTPEVDAGRIMLQRRCTINDVDTPGTLKRKVQKLEGEALCTCIKAAYPRRGDLSKVVAEG